MRIVQTLALFCYRVAAATGLTSTRLGSAAFVAIYNLYKEIIEGESVRWLCGFIEANSVVIDVGANIGFFTVRFAQHVGDSGRVIAVEPEPTNFCRLKGAIARASLDRRVELLQAAAAETNGQAKLSFNAQNPADHRLADEGINVATISLDDQMARRKWPHVSLIKIDVQGAEARVIAGAGEILRRFHPALYLEISSPTSSDGGQSVIDLLHSLEEFGYLGYQLGRRERRRLSTASMAEIVHRRGYADFLFLAHRT